MTAYICKRQQRAVPESPHRHIRLAPENLSYVKLTHEALLMVNSTTHAKKKSKEHVFAPIP
jgi:hypothetical protein